MSTGEISQDYELVPPGCGCPTCGESEMDRLVWIDDEEVECQTCKNRYQPAGPAKPTA